MTIIDFIFVVVFTLIGYGAGRLQGYQLLKKANKLVDEYSERLDRVNRDIIQLRDDYIQAMTENEDDTCDRPGQ